MTSGVSIANGVSVAAESPAAQAQYSSQRPLRVVFAGTPEFAVPCLAALLALPAVTVCAVYSQPDRASGRGQKLQPSAVKALAVEHQIEVYTPLSLKDPVSRAQLQALAPDLMIVVAYGMILPRKILKVPRYGCWNVHASVLPRWRGAAPIQRAIEAMDAETGVGLMQMEAGLDTGPVMQEARSAIAADDTAQSLHDRLSLLGAELLTQGVGALVQTGIVPTASTQAEQGVSYAHKLDKSEAKLDFSLSAAQLEAKVRAYIPFPIAEAELAGERVQLLAAQSLALEACPEYADKAWAGTPPGTLLALTKFGADVRCGAGILRITKLKRAGGKPISAADWLNARADLRPQRTA